MPTARSGAPRCGCAAAGAIQLGSVGPLAGGHVDHRLAATTSDVEVYQGEVAVAATHDQKVGIIITAGAQ